MDKEKSMAEIEKMSMEEKLTLLSQIDKAYIRGYVERAVLEQKRLRPRRKRRPKVAETRSK
jgi:hypothetical protein